MASEDRLNSYFQAVNEGYDALIDAIESSTSHSSKLWDQLLEEARSGQKEAITLGERFVSNPSDPQVYSGVLEASLKAQERTLSFAKVLFEETSGLGADGRKAFERVFAANRSASEAAIELTSQWTGQNAFIDAWRKGVEAVTGMAPASR